MSSIGQALLARQPLPLAEKDASNHFASASKPQAPVQDPSKVAKDFEGVFASMLLKEMRSSLQPGSLFGEDNSDIFGGLFDQFLGQHVADAGGMGLAKMVETSLNQQQADQSRHSPAASKLN